jgi:hypothetical protein
MGSDNPDGAENQQERLIRTGWVIGFVDGEGCFSIGLVRQSRGAGRNGYRVGYQVFHEFAVAQGAKSVRCLNDLEDFFGVGQVLVNRRRDDHREDMHRFVVRRRVDLLERIVPFFRAHPLRSAKRLDFEKFTRCMRVVDQGRHLQAEGLAEIVEIVQTMNRQKPRPELLRILRGHTPDVPDTG